MTKKFTYEEAGVDRKLRAESKKALETLQQTYKFSLYGEVVRLPYGNLLPSRENHYLDLVIEGVGTKVLLAQLANKHDTIGIDGVAMAVNDVIRSGAKPLAVADNIHTQRSDPALTREWLKGIAEGATEAECAVVSGEIGDVAEIIKGVKEDEGFDMVVAAIGEVTEEKMIRGTNVKPGDPILGLRSSGLHSNGITLARKILLKHWGGKYDPHDVPDGFDEDIISDMLRPTEIYVKPLAEVAEKVKIKAAVHITGDAYLKFSKLTKFSPGIGFEFNNFKPQSIFELIQKTASDLGGTITDEEMFKTFNMGWGFAVIVDDKDKDEAIDALETTETQTEQIGKVTNAKGTRIIYKNRRILLQ